MALCYPAPTFTEADLSSQLGKVFIVTGSSSGFGKELAQLLYEKDAKIYVAVRSEEKALKAIADIKAMFPASKGDLIYLHLDLADLTTVKASAEEFMSKESRLDILWNNAGVMVPPKGSKTVQDWELQLGVNTLATSLFTFCLQSVLAATAKTAPANSVRVVWVSSIAAKDAPKPAVDFANINYQKSDESQWVKYRRSKAGTILVATEFGRRVAGDGIISISMEPGVAKTELQRSMSSAERFLVSIAGYEAKKGAITELFAGLSPEITTKTYGQWVVPIGRIQPYRKDYLDETLQAEYYNWIQSQLKPYL